MKTYLKSLGLLLMAVGLALFIILAIVKLNVDKEGAFLCKIVAETPDLSMDECPAHESNNSWLLLMAFSISFLIIGSGAYFAFIHHRISSKTENNLSAASPAPSAPIDASSLDEEEKKIYDLIKLKQGSAYQSDLIKETGMSKVKVSRILDRLEGKQILERKRRGMTNIVILK